jgi:hypothetical protein
MGHFPDENNFFAFYISLYVICIMNMRFRYSTQPIILSIS